MYSQVKEYIATCQPCLLQKQHYGFVKAPMQSFKDSSAMTHIHVDYLGPLPLTRKGNQHVIIFVDILTKWVEARAVPDNTAVTTAKAFYDLIITRHGFPETLLSDRGTNFLSKLTREVCKLLNVHKVNTTAYRPCCNGQVERFNSTLVNSLTKYAHDRQDRWDEYLSSVLFAYRTTRTSPTGETPFMLLYGRQCVIEPDVALLPPPRLAKNDKEYRDLLVENLSIARTLAAERMRKKQEEMKNRYDKTARPPSYKVGDLVLLHDPTKKSGVSKKLSYQWMGPFEIIEQTGPANFKLAGMGQKSEIVHSDRLKPYPTPSKHAIRDTTELEQPHQEADIPDPTTDIQQVTEDLIQQIQDYLDPDGDQHKIQAMPLPRRRKHGPHNIREQRKNTQDKPEESTIESLQRTVDAPCIRVTDDDLMFMFRSKYFVRGLL